MPIKLPDAQYLGALPSADSGRPIATYDTSAIGKSVATLGDTISKESLNYYDREKRAQDAVEDSNARSAFLTARIKLDEERDNITDPDELERHKAKYAAALQTAAQAYRNKDRASRFITDNTPQVEQAGVANNSRAFDLRRDRFVADTTASLDTLREAGLQAKTEEDRVKVITAGREKIAAMEEAGYISAEEARRLEKGWVENYAIGRINMLPPAARMDALRGNVTPTANAKSAYDFFVERGWKPHQAAGIVGNLMQESGMRTTARNAGDGSDGSDSIGIAQWNSDRAARLKRFAAARGADWHDFRTQLEFVDLELRTSEGKAGQALANAKDVREATAAIVGYERPRGSERGAENADGWGNRLRHAETYFGTWGGGKRPDKVPDGDLAGVIPADRRQAMFEQAQREHERERTQQDYDARQEKATVTNLMADDIASIRASGKPVEALTEERLANAVGREAAAQHMRERNAEQKFYDTVSGFGSMTGEQIGQAVERAKPKAGTEGFTEQQNAYDRIAKEAAKTMKQRDEDPASVVDSNPTIAPLVARVRANMNDVDAWRELVRARKTAQRALGIPETTVSPITRAEGRALFDAVLEAGPGQEVAALRDTAKRIDEIFGKEDAPRAFIVGLAAAGVDKATREMAGVMLRRLGLGQPIDPNDARSADQQQANAAEQKAVSSIPPAGGPAQWGEWGAISPDQLTGAAPSSTTPPARTGPIPDGAIRMLIGDPSMAAQFDQKYGPGTAKRILETSGVKPASGASPRK